MGITDADGALRPVGAMPALAQAMSARLLENVP
jgi:hypothetical protein